MSKYIFVMPPDLTSTPLLRPIHIQVFIDQLSSTNPFEDTMLSKSYTFYSYQTVKIIHFIFWVKSK